MGGDKRRNIVYALDPNSTPNIRKIKVTTNILDRTIFGKVTNAPSDPRPNEYVYNIKYYDENNYNNLIPSQIQNDYRTQITVNHDNRISWISISDINERNATIKEPLNKSWMKGKQPKITQIAHNNAFPHIENAVIVSVFFIFYPFTAIPTAKGYSYPVTGTRDRLARMHISRFAHANSTLNLFMFLAMPL